MGGEGRRSLNAASGSNRSPLSRHGLAFVFVGSFCLLWPAFFFGGPFPFADTGPYLAQGAAILDALLQIVAGWLREPPPSSTVGAAAAAAETSPVEALSRRADMMRSLPYAVFAHVANASPLGRFGVAFAQSAIVLAAIWPLAAAAIEERPRGAAAATVFIAVGTSLAWFVCFLMPDVMGAVVVAFALTLIAVVDRIDAAGRVALALLAAFAVMTHYGNIALAAGLIGA
ncbi:MAG: hypothetical protein AAGF90_20265, partial [Pseudomonadota bacterium]